MAPYLKVIHQIQNLLGRTEWKSKMSRVLPYFLGLPQKQALRQDSSASPFGRGVQETQMKSGEAREGNEGNWCMVCHHTSVSSVGRTTPITSPGLWELHPSGELWEPVWESSPPCPPLGEGAEVFTTPLSHWLRTAWVVPGRSFQPAAGVREDSTS